jgi:hypothetical protein
MRIELSNGKSIEIQDIDFEENLSFKQALTLCETIEGNWRLPTVEEFDFFYQELYKNGKGNFSEDTYWTSTTELGNWSFSFNIGGAFNGYYVMNKYHLLKFKIRLIKDI